jgi:periplasmic protein TonB
LIKNLKYPKEASESNAQGIVLLKLILEKDGTISRVLQAKEAPHSSLFAEAKRVALAMPKWKPAKIDGKNVASIVLLPVKFSLN